jgi:deoxyadenosine/deoxycytidine kinase
MPKPDLYIYLYQNSERLLQNIKKRRSYEQKISGIIWTKSIAAI